ncbi:hypothetical protein SEA_ABBYDAISY_62 [Arthrobacter phage AbbyDaisy]|nr:hypothetical protein SEA_ABBYDAISY_62 [Arthrobacter phage AbbyDaisy]
MNDRNDRARALQFAKDLAEPDWSLSVPKVAKDNIRKLLAIIEESKPRTITTVKELDALADGSAVLDADSDISTKHGGRWHGYEMAPLDSRKFSKCGPFTVLHEPESES